MKYWKQGFHLEQDENKSRIEITDEYWEELLEGQSSGKIIYEDKDGYPKLKDWEPNEKDILKEEIRELKQWFDSYYAQHEQKYRRLHTLKILTDENKDPYEELVNLYNEAETKRKRIQELENLIK